VAQRRAERMAKLRAVAFVDEDHMIAIHREVHLQVQRVPNGIVGMVLSAFSANAQSMIHEQKSDADT